MVSVDVTSHEKFEDDITEILMWGRNLYENDLSDLVKDYIREEHNEQYQKSEIDIEKEAKIRFRQKSRSYVIPQIISVQTKYSLALGAFFVSLRYHDSGWGVVGKSEADKAAIERYITEIGEYYMKKTGKPLIYSTTKTPEGVPPF
ncbi:MAG: hypothetical protein ACFFG0_07035 [Candidatus Thorarchaeota archaeon]